MFDEYKAWTFQAHTEESQQEFFDALFFIIFVFLYKYT